MMNENPQKYISELEEKIVELSLKLKNISNELKSIEQSNNKQIGKLIHNLKNPIGIAYSFSDIILGSIDNYPAEKLEKHISVINNSASYSIKLLNDFGLFNELKSPSFENEKTNYIEIINNVVDNFNELALKKNITLVKNISNSAIHLNVNADKISIALGNIISNSLRYSNENSKVTIEVVENSKSVNTTISDEGIGISEADIFSVFNEFFVVNTYSSDKQKCTGLGLPIAKKIIEYYGGKISINSIINKGSTVKISLPLI
ncbi:sensor histidine kinase [Lutibacter flavus]|uniref:histidine kinase n=1 Tax=Lutibacter flavus TaxID=691689 RepID=A0A238X7V8_9FLAO|nr:HAMP domain-containing sensor histidine kinase [Lutibacter flavus]SNR54424.1 Signal transduction histidine kinase [Lutibacter flavus]